MATYTPAIHNEFANGYLYRRPIWIPAHKVDSALTNFPLYVSVEIDTSHFTLHDITFEDTDGNTLDYEIDYLDTDTGHLFAWVKVASIPKWSSTYLYLYYGKSTISSSQEGDPWDSSFVNVYHLEEDADGTADEYEDSKGGNAGQAANGVGTSYVPDDTWGLAWKSSYFDGNDWIDLGDDDIGNGSDLTVSAIIKLDTPLTQKRCFFSRGRTDPDNGYGWCLQIGVDLEGKPYLAIQTTKDEWTAYELNSTTALSTDTMYKLDGVWEVGSGIKLYINGVLDCSKTVTDSTAVPATGGNQIGRVDQTNFWFGWIDELRVSSAVRGADWLKAEWDFINETAINLQSLTEEQLINLTEAQLIALLKFPEYPIEIDGVSSFALVDCGGSVVPSTTFRRVITGGAVCAGSVNPSVVYSNTSQVSGGTVAAGSVSSTQMHSCQISGGAVAAGSVTPYHTYGCVIAGGAVCAGSVLSSVSYSTTITGGAVAAGSVVSDGVFPRTTSGGAESAGSVIPSAIYSNSISGGAVLAGSVISSATYSTTITGGGVCAGSVNPSVLYSNTAQVSGGTVAAGTLIPAQVHSHTVAGGAVAAGSVIPAVISNRDYQISGGAVAAGSVVSAVISNRDYQISGGAVCGGSVNPSVVYSTKITGGAVGAGSVTWYGAAVYACTEITIKPLYTFTEIKNEKA